MSLTDTDLEDIAEEFRCKGAAVAGRHVMRLIDRITDLEVLFVQAAESNAGICRTLDQSGRKRLLLEGALVKVLEFAKVQRDLSGNDRETARWGRLSSIAFGALGCPSVARLAEIKEAAALIQETT